MPEGFRTARDRGEFAPRHRLLLVMLWVQIPVLGAVALQTGEAIAKVALTSSILIGCAVVGMVTRGWILPSISVSLGLLTTSRLVVDYADGAIFSHFHFLLMIGAISLYRAWLPLAFGVLAASAYHFLGPSETVNDAMVHSGVVAALALLLAIGWRLDAPFETGSTKSDRYRLGFEAAPIGMAVLKPSGEFIEVNRAMGRILGYEQSSFVGVNITKLVSTDDQGELGEAWEQMGNSLTHTAVEWMHCLTASGGPIWARVSLSMVPRTLDSPAMVILQLEDDTRSHEEQRRLESLLRGKDEFVEAVSEEIRKPLGVLIDLTDTADHAHVDKRQALPNIEAHAREIASMVDDLVVSAQTGIAPVSVAPSEIDVSQVCRDVVTRIPGADRVVLDFGATTLWGDPFLTRQIVNNLIFNAVRYGGPNITIRTIKSGPDTVIQVIDDGPEIPPDERDRQFTSDLHSGQPVTRPAAVGLSLTVGRHLARVMDGDVVYRRTPDADNLFELRLPTEPINERPRRRARMGTMEIPV